MPDGKYGDFILSNGFKNQPGNFVDTKGNIPGQALVCYMDDYVAGGGTIVH